MHKVLYAIFIRNSFERIPYIFASNGNQCFNITNIYQLRDYDTIISYGFKECIDEIRTKGMSLSFDVIDTEIMKKLCIGKPKRGFNVNLPWSLRNIIGKVIDQSALAWLKDIYEMKILKPESYDAFKTNIEKVLKAFVESYNSLLIELKEKNEYNRFFDIEVPIYNIFLKAQLKGIYVSQENLLKQLKKLKKDYYKSIKRLEFEYNFKSHYINYDMSWNDISQHVDLIDFKDDFDYKFWDTVELLKKENDFLEMLETAKTSYHDYNELLKYKLDSYHRIYPEFDVIGTVTSRVLITRPGIQYLKRSNRNIFIPQENMKFLYADFDQFEPGILASYAEDEAFIQLYNRNDIYNELSQLLFQSTSERKTAKILFLSFIYGMRRRNIAKLIEKMTDRDTSEKGLSFFDVFQGLQEWKEKIIRESEIKGYSSSVLGNARYLNKKNESTNAERRWIPNQFIQGTASYILKKSIIELYRRCSEINILIPMHDALLVETPSDEERTVKDMIRSIFVENFLNVCPKINASVSFEDFVK